MSEQDEAQGWGGGLWAKADLVTPMAIRVAATLRLGDRIAAGTATATALAEAVGAEPDALRRVLEHLVTAGVLTGDGERYALTALGKHLRDDDPSGVRPWLDLDGAVGRADLCFTDLLHTVRTGEPAFPQRFGRPYWDYLAADPALSATFDALMGARLVDATDVAAAYPWDELGHLVDVGGGNGTLLLAILRAHPDLRGTVVDLAGTVERADERIASAGLDGRAGTAAGSFFDALPPGAGGYLLSGVLHDWDDAEATRILQRCADAAGADGRVLVLEHPGDARGRPDTEGDLRMLCYVRGRERTVDDFAALAAGTGLRVASTVRVGMRVLLDLRAT